MNHKIPGNLLTTAMGVMPHTDVALDLVLSLDVPFWPQLPNDRYYEDMYVQASENFPGIILDIENRTLRFSMDKFTEEIEETLLRFDDPGGPAPGRSSVRQPGQGTHRGAGLRRGETNG